MQNYNKEFIDKYKELEQFLRTEKNLTVREYEDTIEEGKLKKLQYCRNTRNYLQHEPDGDVFVSVSKGMVVFVEDLLLSLQREQGTIKDNMCSLIKWGKLSPEDTLKDGISLMYKIVIWFGTDINVGSKDRRELIWQHLK